MTQGSASSIPVPTPAAAAAAADTADGFAQNYAIAGGEAAGSAYDEGDSARGGETGGNLGESGQVQEGSGTVREGSGEVRESRGVRLRLFHYNGLDGAGAAGRRHLTPFTLEHSGECQYVLFRNGRCSPLRHSASEPASER